MDRVREIFIEYVARCRASPSTSRGHTSETLRGASRWASEALQALTTLSGSERLECASALFREVTTSANPAVRSGDAPNLAYNFVFLLIRDPGARTAPKERACEAWEGALTTGRASTDARARDFFAYVRTRDDVRGITADVWTQTCVFIDCLNERGEDLNWYDDAEAWPTLFDEYVEFCRAASRANTPSIELQQHAGGGVSGGHHQRTDTTGDFVGNFARALAAGGIGVSGDMDIMDSMETDTSTRKRRLSEPDPEVIGLSREFARELAVGRTPKRVCSEMDLNDED
jgi:hypothetical protein